MQRQIELKGIPARIISLVPSQTEYLWDLGLHEEIIGITKFCIHPAEMFQMKPRVGGTKQLDLEKIRALKPDLIIGNKEENTKEDIAELEKEFPVWMSDVNTLDDALAMMQSLAEICGKVEQGEVLISQAKASLNSVKGIFKGQSTLYFMWYDPWMCAASDTFIHEILQHLGFENVLAHEKRYPLLNLDLAKTLNPSICLLSSEPFPFAEKHAQELKKLFPNSKIVFVDGELFSWYGSRLGKVGREMRALQARI